LHNLKPNIIEIAANARRDDESVPTGVYPSGRTRLGCAVVRAPVADLAKDRDRPNSGQYRERANSSSRSKCPHWLEAGEPRGEAGFETFANRQSECHVFVSVEFDRGLLGATQHLSFELTAAAV
jgi:hypothetical protein